MAASLQELHDDTCGNHFSELSLSNHALRMRHCRPMMKQDAITYVTKCDSCQRHAGMMHKPSELLHLTLTHCPFMKLGMDIVGNLPSAPRLKVFMLALTNNFCKWIEANSFQQVHEKEVISFIHTNINASLEYCQKLYARMGHNL